MNQNGKTTDLPVLVLSIHKIHADRIFREEKFFELRKVLPSGPLGRVYLYASGGTGVIGCFDPGEIIKKNTEELWEEVGEKATTQERFLKYFNGREKGCAIPINNPIEFSSAILPAELKKLVPKFTAPQSYLIVQPDTSLFRILESKRSKTILRPSVKLRPIKRAEEPKFVSLITSEIATKYAEITKNFAQALVEKNRLGSDPTGIFTTKKEVLSIEDSSGVVIGFTTLTHKIGGSVKTGPTALLRKYRGMGFGAATRAAIEGYARSKKCRKLYCTCPDDDSVVINYILQSGFQIEAHLAKQYHASHGELVFGKFISRDSRSNKQEHHTLNKVNCTVVKAEEYQKQYLVSELAGFIRRNVGPISTTQARSIVSRAQNISSDDTFEDKPLGLVCLEGNDEIQALVLLVPKRGGGLKAMMFTRTSHVPSIKKAIGEVEKFCRTWDRRKIYFLQTLHEPALVKILVDIGYEAEGVLKEPYRAGEDLVICSKFLSRN